MPHEGRSSGATKWPRLRFQVWDFDFFSFDDSIAECVLSLKGLCQRVMKTQKRIQLYNKKGKKGEKDRIWIKNLRHPKFKGNQGRLQVSIEILPKHMADLDYPAGFGRSDPNMNSFLPEPAGRVIWSLYRPLDMLRELIGNKMYYKLCCCLFCFFFTFVLLLMGPSLISAMIANSLDD